MVLILEILAISAALSMLTYVMGTLIYALPLHFYGIKKWAPILISDAILTFTLTSSFFLILWMLDKFYDYLGIDRSESVESILKIDKGLASTYITLDYLSRVMKTVFNKFPLGKLLEAIYVAYSRVRVFTDIFTRPFLDMFLSSLRLAVYSWTALYILARISELLLPAFLSLGILLMSVPFKITRSAGALLFSLGVVLYVMTPLVVPFLKFFIAMAPTLANFLEWITSNALQLTPYNVFYLQGKVIDEQGNPVAYAMVYFCDDVSVCGAYPTNALGFFDTAYTLGGVPWPTSHIYVEVLGVKIKVSDIDWRKFYINPDTLITDSKIEVHGLIAPDPGFIIYIPCSLYYYTEPPKFETTSDGYLKMYFKFTALDDCRNVTIAFSGIFDERTLGIYLSSNARNPTLQSTIWNGITVWMVRFDVKKGDEVDISISGKKSEFKTPELYELGYLSNKLGLELLERITDQRLTTSDLLLAPFFLASVPYIYITMMMITVYSLATALSGGVKRVIIKTW